MTKCIRIRKWLIGALLAALIVTGCICSPVYADWPTFRHDPEHTGYTDEKGPKHADLRWSYQTGELVTSSPAVADGRVYVGSVDGYVYCLNAADGSLAWRYKTGSGVWSSPAVADGKVYVGSYDGYVYCL